MKQLLCAAVLLSTALNPLPSSAEGIRGVYVILDGSGSMWGQLSDGTHKITAAREVLKSFVADDYAGREVAFRVYGHRREGDCTDSELVVPFSAPDQALAKMAAFAEGVNPKGKTPISRSLRAALEDFGDRPGEVILISDGIETCDEDPCALVRAWRAQDVDIRVHVVGLGLEDKERAAMQCISDAAGTEYRDARSADELAAGMKKIQESAGDPEQVAPPEWRVLTIVATNEAGESLRVQGTAQPAGSDELINLSSNGRRLVPAGEVEVTLGVRTWNGTLYRPVTKTVTVAAQGETKLEVVVPEPPSVQARFLEGGADHGGAFVKGFQGDDEVLGFRPMDRAYIDPGTYEFRTKPNADNELKVTETFNEGDHKEIVFNLVQTVQAHIKMVAAGSGIEFSTNYELWQGDEKKYTVHQVNGVRALPGIYDLKLPLRLTPYLHKGLEITPENGQEYRIEVPVGHVTIQYHNTDGSPMKDARCFLTRKNENGQWLRDRVSTTGHPIPLVPGTYRLEGWDRLGNFDELIFEMTVGEEKELVLRDQGDES